MKKVVIALFFSYVVAGCNNDPATPDVSHIRMDIPVQRFERDFFSLNTAQLSTSLDSLYSKYPAFFQDYLSLVMGYEAADTALKYIPLFIKDSLYKDVYQEANRLFSDFTGIEKEVEQGMRFLKYYFPKYQAPTGIITFIGPMDGIATGITSEHKFAIGLQGYLGKNYPAYHTSYIREFYPAYKSRKFEPQYIAVNCMMTALEDMSPTRNAGKPLVEQMIKAGKKLYVLDLLLPAKHDTLVTGYTKAQLDAAYENEVNIWSHFLTNDLLYTTDPVTIRDYMNEAPHTIPLGPASPGFIGQFVGWQIVKKWMSRNEKTAEQLMQTPAKEIFETAKYKPS